MKGNKSNFLYIHGIQYIQSDLNENDNNKNENIFINKYIDNKYNNKQSYYLTTKNPWNNNSVFEDKDRNNINKKIIKNIKKVHLKNEIINI